MKISLPEETVYCTVPGEPYEPNSAAKGDA